MMTTTITETMTTTRSTTTTTKAQRQRRWKILLCCSATLICAVAVVVLFWNNSGTQHNFLKGNKSYYRSSKSTTTLSSTSSTSNSAAKDLIKVFDQVLMISSTNNNKKKKSKQQHHHQDNIIHVGNLLEACEILAETIRDIGFSHSANDIMGNINKVRNLYDRFPSSSTDENNNNNKELSIQVLIEYELDAGIHKDVTKSFDEQSASMGLLWLGRNINYQYDLFTHLLNDDDNMEPYEAAKKAYQDDLKPHLNWTLQQVGQAALLTLKPMKKITILNKISGRRRNMDDNDNEEEEDLETIQQDLKQVLSKWKPLLNKYKQTFHELNLGHKI